MIDFGPAANEEAEAARLIYESFREYYDLVPTGPEQRIALIAAQIGLTNSELANTTVAIESGACVGVYSVLPSNALAVGQFVGLQRLMGVLAGEPRQRFRSAIEAFRGKVPVSPADSLHIARFAVAERMKGTGLADKMIAHLRETPIAQEWRTLSLHVRANNKRARAFYERNGFTTLERTDSYLMMTAPRG